MSVITIFIRSLLTQDFFLSLALQTLILFIFPHFIFLIRNKRKKPILHFIFSIFSIIPLLALLIFFPIKLGPIVAFDFSSIFLMIAMAIFGNVVSIVTIIAAVGLSVLKSTDNIFLRLVPYLVGVIIVFIGNQVQKKQSKKIFYAFVFIALLLNSISLFLTTALLDPTTPIILLSLFILMLIVPIFGVGIVALLNSNSNFLIEHEIVISQETLLKSLLTSSYNIQIIAVDLDYNYLSFNEQHDRLLSKLYKTKAVVGQSILTAVDNPIDRRRVEANLSRALSGEAFEVEIQLAVKQGFSFQESYAPIKDQNGAIIGATIYISELSERVKREEQIKYFSYHDQGTGLYNRRYFDNYALKLRDYKGPICVVYADINGLKITNDLFGHAAGDELLLAVTGKLKNEFKNEMIARIGGDEIVIVLRTGELENIQKKIKRIQQEFQETIVSYLLVSVSFGVASAPSGAHVLKAQQDAEYRMYYDKLNSVNTQHKNVVDVLLAKIAKDHNLGAIEQEIHDLSLLVGKDLGLTAVSMDLLKEVVKLHPVACIYPADRCPYFATDLSAEETAILHKRLIVVSRLILTSELYNPVSFDVVSIFENYNGSGTPRGLQGKEIPLKARIVRFVGDYVLLKLRKRMTTKETLDILAPHVNEFYDPLIFKTVANKLIAKSKNEQ